MKPLNSIVNIILLTMSVRLVVSGDHSIIEQHSLRSIIYFVFILFKTNISSRRTNILFANSVTEPLISLVTVQNSMDRSINSTCNKQTIVSYCFVESRNNSPPCGNVKRRRKTIKKQLYLRDSQWKATVHVSKLLSPTPWK